MKGVGAGVAESGFMIGLVWLVVYLTRDRRWAPVGPVVSLGFPAYWYDRHAWPLPDVCNVVLVIGQGRIGWMLVVRVRDGAIEEINSKIPRDTRIVKSKPLLERLVDIDNVRVVRRYFTYQDIGAIAVRLEIAWNRVPDLGPMKWFGHVRRSPS